MHKMHKNNAFCAWKQWRLDSRASRLFRFHTGTENRAAKVVQVLFSKLTSASHLCVQSKQKTVLKKVKSGFNIGSDYENL